MPLSHSEQNSTELDRLLTALSVRTQLEGAEILGVRQSLLSDSKRRGGIVTGSLLEKAVSAGIRVAWIKDGILPMRQEKSMFAKQCSVDGYCIAQCPAQQDESLAGIVQRITHLAAQSKKLEDKAKVLLFQAENCKESARPEPMEAPEVNADDDLGETRCYYLSRFLLDDERELLRECEAKTLSDALAGVYDALSGIVLLMCHVDDECALPGYIIQTLGENMNKKLELLMRIQSCYDDMDLQ